jgi:uroporphyrinogen-III synthase
VAPLFEVRPVQWDAPEPGGFDALMLTSANAARHAGPQLRLFADLPCYCVGDATAAAAREAGLTEVRVGPSDGAALLAQAAADGATSLLHLCGCDHISVEHPSVRVQRLVVYASEPVGLSDAARAALDRGAIVLLHSPRMAAEFAAQIDARHVSRTNVALAAISPAAARAVGEGWAAVQVAAEPRDPALLALAARLCQNGRMAGSGLAG